MAAFIVPDYQTRTYPNPERSKAYCLIGQPYASRGSFVVIEQSTERRSTANPLPRRPTRAVIDERVVHTTRAQHGASTCVRHVMGRSGVTFIN